jgi:hypothetical protein
MDKPGEESSASVGRHDARSASVAVEAPDGKAVARSRPRSFARGCGFRVAAILLALIGTTVVLELGFRYYLLYRLEYMEHMRKNTGLYFGGELQLYHMVRESKNRWRVYELIPGANGLFVDQPLRINSAGFRDRERQVRKPPGTYRIAVLGDSVAFGWGVKVKSRFSDVLETFLNDEAPTSSTRYECLNFAVPGYNSVMELATLRDCGMRYEPDALVLCLVSNDDELPNFVRSEPEVLSLRKCFILEALRDLRVGRRSLGDLARDAGGGIRDPGAYLPGARAIGFRPELVPPEYRFLVGRDAMARALEEMAALAAENQIPVLCLMNYIRLDVFLEAPPSAMERNYNSEFWELSSKVGFIPCDPLQSLVRHLKENKLREGAFWVKPRDVHPNATANAIFAREIFRTMIAHRLLPDSEKWKANLPQAEERWARAIHEAATQEE